ncbi:MAG: hypothetical protein OWT28_12195 [Firmicutes bacterium]|nr:hypothetical protein [Bacillota bacterium]
MKRWLVFRQMIVFTLQLTAIAWAVRHTKRPQRWRTAWGLLSTLRIR